MIHIHNLTFAYPKQVSLFSGLNLTLLPGNIYGLLGKNGAGKTTLLKLITGLRFPQSGDCRVMNYLPGQRSPKLLRELYFIPEEFSTPNNLTVTEYKKLYAPFYPRFNDEKFADILHDFDLSAKDRLAALSFGQKKKFLLAFGLATESRLLILDEPTNGLDIPAKSRFRKLLAASLSAERTFIISTHQVRDMENLIDPVIILDAGEIIFQHNLQEVAEHVTVQLQTAEPDPDTVLYSEKVLGGYAVMTPNKNGSESRIDLEILFNAVIRNRAKITALFSQEVSDAA